MRVEIVVPVLVLFAIFVAIRLSSRRKADDAYRKRVQQEGRRARADELDRWKLEDESEARYHREILAAEALRSEQASGILPSDLQSIRAAHPSHVDPFMLIRRGWNPSIIEDLNPAEIFITCEDGRELPLYSTGRVQESEEDALDRSQDYVYRLCDKAYEEEQRKEQQLLAEEQARMLRERMKNQIAVDISAIRNKTTNEPPKIE